jgi:phosphatidylinositol alpha-1,6-mannosyltransferase
MAEPSLRVLALVTDAFGSHGGISQYNCDFLSALAACEGISEVIVLPRATERSPDLLPAGVQQLHPVNGRLAYSLAALQAAKAFQPINVVFCGHLFMAPLAVTIAKLLRTPLWLQVHGTDAWGELSFFYRRSIEMAALITSVSRYTRRRLLEWVGIDPVRVKVLPNTVDPRFQPGPKPGYLLERHAAHGKKVLMTVSRLASSEQYKGHDRVIRVLPRVLLKHPETIYIIVGDGDDRPRLEALAAEYGVAQKVYFVGRVAPEELPDHFRLADVFVMPSTGEGFGIVFLEAMTTGIHVISGNRDGSLDPLADGVLGRAVDPDNGEELTSAICTALCDAPAKVDLANRFNDQAFTEHLHELVRSNFSAH